MKLIFKLSILLVICFAFLTDVHSSNKFSGSKPQNPILKDTKTLDQELTPVVNQWFEEIKIPGAIIGVFMNGYEPYRTAIGVSDLSTNAPIRLDDKMRIGSITKTFTGTVVLQLVDEGMISLSDKLSKYFPDFPNGDNITIDELGNMTSGIYNYSEDSTFGAALMSNMTKAYTPMELVDLSKSHPPYFAPGTSFHYSNSNTVLLGLIIEKLTGNPLQAEIQNRILNRLGMKNSTFELNSNFPDPHSHGYMYLDSTSTAPTDVTVADPSWGWAAGAMISTLEDVEKYAKPLATGELISKSSQEARLTWGKPFYPPTGAWRDEKLNYGFAIADFAGAIGHNGGIPGFNSFMGYYPEKDVTIIVLANMQDNKAGIGPADDLGRRILTKIKQM
ncbi:MAG: serine hydrolase domain-containing protein [Ignavibacteria bacterium]